MWAIHGGELLESGIKSVKYRMGIWYLRRKDIDDQVIEVTNKDFDETIKTLVSQGQCDPMVGNHQYASSLFAWKGPSETLRWLLYQDIYMIDTVPIQWREPTLRHQDSLYHQHIHRLSALWSDHKAHEICTVTDCCGRTVLYMAVEQLVQCYSDERPYARDSAPGLKRVISFLLTKDVDIHAQMGGRVTLLDVLIIGRHRLQHRYERVMSSGLDELKNQYKQNDFMLSDTGEELIKWWLDALADAGVDLRLYGETEESLYGGRKIEPLPFYDPDFTDMAQWHSLAFENKFYFDPSSNKLTVTSTAYWETLPDFGYNRGRVGKKTLEGQMQDDKANLRVPGSWV